MIESKGAQLGPSKANRNQTTLTKSWKDRAETVVIGAGVGVSIAYHLARLGRTYNSLSWRN
ncbi:uncharacterized protein LOC143237750 isoform X2 [Tachypleus tridentatus]|uniref:uncharacterized protein LOC143237750 isoform X2 n=1 Tax=Tachypleus tridentatus TaxID=6853 RepID=UPI003FD448EC